MKRVAIFPGSFDPITLGHESVIRRALPLFDELVVAIGVNSAKNYLFTLEQRQKWLQELFKGEEKIRVASYTNLTVEYCKSVGARYILRGLRNSVDFNYEKSIAQMNWAMNKEIETIFLLTSPDLSAINANIVRDIYVNGGEISAFIPKGILIPPYTKRN